MEPTLELQPWVTIQGDAGESGEFQDLDLWINTGAHRAGVLEIEAPSISGCTLYVEGCDVAGGAFVTHTSFNASTTAVARVYLNRNAPFGVAERLGQLIRWRLDAGGAAWTATFRISLVLK